MVVRKLTEHETDLLFQALADATRRDIVERVIRGEQSVSALASAYDVSFAAVQKHVAVLERAGLVTKERRGREQIVHSDIERVGRARSLLESYQALWHARFDRIAGILAEEP